LAITPEQRGALRRLVQQPTAPQRAVRRAQIILHRADGLSQAEAARRVGVNRPVVVTWEQRFGAAGLAGLAEAQGRGRKPSVALATKAAIVSRATPPPPGRTRWSVRSMAQAMGVSKATVQRLWRANDLKPHLVRGFKLSNDPQFEAKFWDVIGLYLQPPDKALVLCCDEKSQCQALERSQPGLPLGIGHGRTRTHDYTRHGTITLFAALSYLDGKIFSQTALRQTHQQWLGFLKQLDKDTPGELALHLILDNYATHKHPKVHRWIVWRNARQRRQHGGDRIVLHFTPTSSSWLNLVERFFRDLTQEVVREGSFASVPDLVRAITDYLAEHNLAPKRYLWNAKGEDILAKILRARAALQHAHIV
jgi:transposase/transcriptional regulator with XRE-family HTH domain